MFAKASDMSKTTLKITDKITNSSAAYDQLKPFYNKYCEEFWAIYLNHQLQILQMALLHRGTLNYCTVHPRDLFRQAFIHNSYTMIIAHNHVSGELEPSIEDIKLTKKLIKISQITEISMTDHLIFNDKKYFSFKENQILF